MIEGGNTVGERREERMRGTSRLIRLHEDEGAFDRAFWRSIPPARRLEMVWDMVVESVAWRGSDGSQSRLQRSIFRIERRRG